MPSGSSSSSRSRSVSRSSSSSSRSRSRSRSSSSSSKSGSYSSRSSRSSYSSSRSSSPRRRKSPARRRSPNRRRSPFRRNRSPPRSPRRRARSPDRRLGRDSPRRDRRDERRPSPRRDRDRRSPEHRKLSRSKSPRRSSPPEKQTELFQLCISNLPRSTNKDHIQEIFDNFGTIAKLEHSIDRRSNLPHNKCYVSYREKGYAEKAIEYMDQAQVDGFQISVQFTLPYENKPQRNFSPNRRGGISGRGGGSRGKWRRSPSPNRGVPGRDSPTRVNRRSPSPKRAKVD